jgi:NitT/TauT family transport system substrate-binding protein
VSFTQPRREAVKGSAEILHCSILLLLDINSQFSAPSITRIEAGDPVVFLGGLHVGCFELFATEKIRAVRDLKGKRVAIPAFGTSQHVFLASIVAHVGLDPSRDINFVTYPGAQSMQLFIDGKIDALLNFPPLPSGQERAM